MTVEYGDERIDIVADTIALHRPQRMNVDRYHYARLRCECGSGEAGSPWDGAHLVDPQTGEYRSCTNKEAATAEFNRHLAMEILRALELAADSGSS